MTQADKVIHDLIAFAGFTPDDAIAFVENQPVSAELFSDKVIKQTNNKKDECKSIQN